MLPPYSFSSVISLLSDFTSGYSYSEGKHSGVFQQKQIKQKAESLQAIASRGTKQRTEAKLSGCEHTRGAI